MKRLLGAFMSVFFTSVLFSQNDSCHSEWIYYPEIGTRFFYAKPDTIKDKQSDGGAAEIIVLNCWGKAIVKRYDKKGNLVFEGAYCESIGLLKTYILVEDLVSGQRSYVVFTHYEPLKDGNWIYYNSKGKIKKKEVYKKGILQ